MPIYEYRCSSCGFQKEYLQKISDPLRSSCPECGKESFQKMLTAAGFQLKGSGWYATDFKGNGTKPKEKKTESTKGAGSAKGAESTKGTEGTGETAVTESPKVEAPVSAASAPAASPVANSGS